MRLLSFVWFPGLEVGVRIRLGLTATSVQSRARKNWGCVWGVCVE